MGEIELKLGIREERSKMECGGAVSGSKGG